MTPAEKDAKKLRKIAKKLRTYGDLAIVMREMKKAGWIKASALYVLEQVWF